MEKMHGAHFQPLLWSVFNSLFLAQGESETAKKQTHIKKRYALQYTE